MSDISIFPAPLEVDPLELESLGTKYRATELSFGTNAFGNILSDAEGSSLRCIQQVMRVLLTKKGSVPNEVNYGSRLQALKGGYDPDTLTEDIVLMLLDVEAQCKAKDRLANTALSAQLGGIELLDLQLLDRGTLKISIGVTTVTGIVNAFDIAV